MRSNRRKPLPEGEFAADIHDLAEDGRGVARVQGKVVFVADALPGERVRYRYLRLGRDVDEAQALAVDTPSPDRVEPRCPHFGLCGGCSLQHLAPEAQLRFKQKQMLDALARLGRVAPDEIAPPIAGAAWGYRRRARLGVKYVSKRGTAVVGFRERASPFLAALDSCAVLDPRVGGRLRELGELVTSLSLRQQLPQIEVACAETVALVLRVLDRPSDEDRAKLERFARAHDVDLYLQPGGPDTVAPLTPESTRALRYAPLAEPDYLYFEPTDFVQVNEQISRAAVAQALSWLELAPGARVLELFCGLGNFSIPLARAGARVTALEGEAALVERARRNAARLQLTIDFQRADLFAPAADAPWLQQPYDAVLLDPPRAGAQQVVPFLGRLGARRILYISCHPGTLARDAGMLVYEQGYRLRRAGVMDMFTHTAHIESMALFERGDG